VCILHSVEMHSVCTEQSRGALFVFTSQFRNALCVYFTVWIGTVCGLHRLARICVCTAQCRGALCVTKHFREELSLYCKV